MTYFYVLLIVLGFTLRVYCIRKIPLENPLKIDIPSDLITQGIYKYVRNPMYLGSLIMFIGLSLLLTDIKVTILLVYIINQFLLERIYKEEDLLLRYFGLKYLNYKNNTKRYIPFVY